MAIPSDLRHAPGRYHRALGGSYGGDQRFIVASTWADTKSRAT